MQPDMRQDPTVLVQNLEPNDASANEFAFQLMMEGVIHMRAVFPVDRKSGKNNHAYLYFNTDTEACKAAEMLNGHRFGNSILRAMALVEGAVKQTTPEKPPQNAETLLHPGGWPSLCSSHSPCGSVDDAASTSTWLSQGSTVKAVTVKKPVKQWCECCKRNTHNTQDCRVLQYQWKQRGTTCGYCKNIKDRFVDIHHPIEHKGMTVCPMILKKQEREC